MATRDFVDASGLHWEYPYFRAKDPSEYTQKESDFVRIFDITEEEFDPEQGFVALVVRKLPDGQLPKPDDRTLNSEGKLVPWAEVMTITHLGQRALVLLDQGIEPDETLRAINQIALLRGIDYVMEPGDWQGDTANIERFSGGARPPRSVMEVLFPPEDDEFLP